MKWYVQLLAIWIILIAVGLYLSGVSFGPDIPVDLVGKILIVVGVIILIIWAVKVGTQFIKNT